MVTPPPGFITCNPLGPRLTTSFPDIVATRPPWVTAWVPIQTTEAPEAETARPLTFPTTLSGLGATVGRAKVVTTPPGLWTTSPLAPRVATLLDPARVTALPPDVIVWPLITTFESPGAAEIGWPPIVAITCELGGGGGGEVGAGGFAKKVAESPELVPPMKTPDVPTETTTGWLFESVIVVTDPGFAVEPFGSTTPDDPGMALMVWLPIVAIAVAEAGVEGVNAGGAGGVLEGGGGGGGGGGLAAPTED